MLSLLQDKFLYMLLFRSMWFRLALVWLIGLEALAQGTEAPVWATSYSVQGKVRSWLLKL
jgi:hypothetical protein